MRLRLPNHLHHESPFPYCDLHHASSRYGGIMSAQSYTLTTTVDAAPRAVFDAISDVRGWWSQEVEGRTDEVGTEFRYRGHDDDDTVEHLATIRVTELVPGEK